MSTTLFFVFLLLLVFTGLGIFLIYRSMQDPFVRVQYASLLWQKINGVVLDCDIRENVDSSGDKEGYTVSVGYEYIVNGSRYIGSDSHRSVFKKIYKTGSSIKVRYDPTRPKVSRIWIDWNYAMVPGCGFIITLVGIGILVFWFIIIPLLQ